MGFKDDPYFVKTLPNYSAWRIGHGGSPDRAIQKTFDLVFTALAYLTDIGVASPPKEVTTTPYSAQPADALLLVNLPVGTTAINLVAGVVNKRVTIKDKKGTAGVDTITIYPSPGETIDGKPSLKIDGNYASATLVFFGTEWSQI